MTNGQMLEFVRDGGYRDRRYWTDAGWGWRAFRNAKCPVFWTAVGPDGLHQYRLRTTFEGEAAKVGSAIWRLRALATP